MDRLQLLVFSFYREDASINKRLEPLKKCKLMRSGGSIRIECIDREHMEEISQLFKYIKLPFEALGLARQIVVRVEGEPQRNFSIEEEHSILRYLLEQ